MLGLCLRMAVDFVVCLCLRLRAAVCGCVYRAWGVHVVYQKSIGGSCTLEFGHNVGWNRIGCRRLRLPRSVSIRLS